MFLRKNPPVSYESLQYTIPKREIPKIKHRNWGSVFLDSGWESSEYNRPRTKKKMHRVPVITLIYRNDFDGQFLGVTVCRNVYNMPAGAGWFHEFGCVFFISVLINKFPIKPDFCIGMSSLEKNRFCVWNSSDRITDSVFAPSVLKLVVFSEVVLSKGSSFRTVSCLNIQMEKITANKTDAINESHIFLYFHNLISFRFYVFSGDNNLYV